MNGIDLSPERRESPRPRSVPVWISHRGVRSTGQGENTAGAFACAMAKKFQWLETDLRMTKDSHIVLSHDENLDRALGRLSSPESSSTELKNLSRREILEMTLPCGGKTLFLDEFLKQFYDVNWVFDVKPPTAQDCLKKLRIMIDQMPNPKEVEGKITFLLWSSGDETVARDLFRSAQFFARPSECWRAGLLSWFGLGFLGGIKAGRAYSLTATLGIFSFISLFNRRIFNEYQSRGAKIILYLTDSREELVKGVEAGADFILSDELNLSSP